MLTYVIDLYAGDLATHPNAVALDDAWLDRTGYYALARKDPARQLAAEGPAAGFLRRPALAVRGARPLDPPPDRPHLAVPGQAGGLRLPDFTLSDDEMNTYSCRWHHNLTAAVCSFRTAKALRTNPGSRHAIPTFRWPNSRPRSTGTASS